jgi:hypothetical protein
MRLLSLPILLFAIITSPSLAGDKIAFEVFAKGYFVKNNAKLPGNPAYVLIADKKAFDDIFGFGRVMGPAPKLVDAKLFETNLIATVIKSGNTLWKYEVESVSRDKDRLVVKYSAKGMESPSATFRSPLIVSIPRGNYTEVVFVENGKEVGKQKSAPRGKE